MDVGRINIVGAQFKDMRGLASDNKLIIAEIVIIDKTETEWMVYQLKQSAASEMKNTRYTLEWLRSQREPFMLLGEMQSIDKKQKMIALKNGQNVAYQYLVVVGGHKGPKGSSDQTMEFSAGIHALLEALRLRQQGLVPASLARDAQIAAAKPKHNVFSEDPKSLKGVGHVMNNLPQDPSSGKSPPDTKLLFEVHV